MSQIPPDCNLDNYNYHLPDESIAKRPAVERSASRLMVLERSTGQYTDASFADIGSFLPPKSLLVANNVAVIPARLLGRRVTGGRVEFLLLTPLPRLEPLPGPANWQRAQANGLLRASKRPKIGEVIHFGPELSLAVLERADYGHSRVELRWQGDLAELLRRVGHVPLPPYLERPDDEADRQRYQTTYADPAKAGAVAAPTAGLHFTPQLRDGLVGAGHGWAELTLYVGYGTFSPVRCQDVRQHRMHAEYVEIPAATARAVASAKAEGRPVVAVGTTSARALEGAAAAGLAIGKRPRITDEAEPGPFAGEVNLFITPGFELKVVDALITNFHLPGSTLIMLVSALAGREPTLAAYRHAVEAGYRFYSYGDAMFIR